MFLDLFSQYQWQDVKQSIHSKSSADVERAISHAGCGELEDFKALLSPAAAPYLEAMAQTSQCLTQQRFGKTIQFYVPLYLSNRCHNICTYCGFSIDNKIRRSTLTPEQMMAEVQAIKAMGFEHLLLVTGEANSTVGIDYFVKTLDLLRPHFPHLSMEVQPLTSADYQRLKQHGLNAVLLYQETYQRETYQQYHLRGNKMDFDYRLATHDRTGSAGIHKIGLGTLLGLEDWRCDAFFTALHLSYLEKKYWQTKYAISFPRLRPNASGFTVPHPMSDRELVQLICAYRIFNGEVELSLSTRESATFRDHVFSLGITSMSAGSKTEPGGYASGYSQLQQFEISDDRSPQQISAMISTKGYEPVWKDWDPVYDSCDSGSTRKATDDHQYRYKTEPAWRS